LRALIPGELHQFLSRDHARLDALLSIVATLVKECRARNAFCGETRPARHTP
jgi:hypothetical protein